MAPINANIKGDSRRGKPFDGKASGRGSDLAPITKVGLAKLGASADPLSIGNPLTVNGPTPAEPEDNSGVTTQRRGKAPKREGERGKGPIVKGVTKSPSESVGDSVEQVSQLTENPFDNAAKPAKQNKKKAGNPAEKNGPGALKENTHVDAEAVRPLNDMPFRRFAAPEAKQPEDMSPSQAALWNWSQRR